MKPYNKIKIGDLFVIPDGTEIWSVTLQEKVITTRDIVIKITNTCIPENNYLFGIIQIIFNNHELAALIGASKARGFADKTNGEIGVLYDKLIDYNVLNSLYF